MNAPVSPPIQLDLDRDLLGGSLRAEVFWASVGADWRALFRKGAVLPEGAHVPIQPEVAAQISDALAQGRPVELYDSGAPDLARQIAARFAGVTVVSGPKPGASDRPSRRVPMAALRKQLRVHQWVKNLLVFLPLIAAHSQSGLSLMQAIGAFAAFSVIASAVYVLNDLSDLDADRRHATKRNRPFAAGTLPAQAGLPLLFGLVLLGGGIAASVSLGLVVVLAIYLVLTTAYSMHLKGQLGLDIVVLALLYTMRIVAGAAATGIFPSVWLLSFSIFIFLSLAAVKRLSELVDLDGTPGPRAAAGRAYVVADRPIIAMIATSAGFIAVLVLALYLDSPEVRAQYAQPLALWGICLLLLFWISRIVLLANRGLVHQDPVVFALQDRTSRLVAVLTALLFAAAILA